MTASWGHLLWIWHDIWLFFFFLIKPMQHFIHNHRSGNQNNITPHQNLIFHTFPNILARRVVLKIMELELFLEERWEGTAENESQLAKQREPKQFNKSRWSIKENFFVGPSPRQHVFTAPRTSNRVKQMKLQNNRNHSSNASSSESEMLVTSPFMILGSK